MPAKKQTKDPMDVVLANIERAMGKPRGTKSKISRFGNRVAVDIPSISFGNAQIDAASYCGGVPRGVLIEMFGPESSGKSLLAYKLIADGQKQGLECALLDAEHSFSPEWAASHGIDVEKLFYINDFTSGEEALEYAVKLSACKKFGLLVIDSTAALVPKAELDGSLTDKTQPGVQARMLSQGVRKLMDAMSHGLTTVIFINQVRMKIGVVYGNPETTPGGKTLKFYSHQRIRVAKKSGIKVKEAGKDVVVGQISTATFVKNKSARPFGRAEFKIVFDAAALNPVVMMAQELKTLKLISIYKGVLRIKKGVLDNKDTIETGATSMVELADYFIKNNLVLQLLDVLIEEHSIDPTVDPLDDAILEMKTNPATIVSPTNASFSAEEVEVPEEEVEVLQEETAVDEKDLFDADAPASK